MRLIDADELNERMYHKSFETDDGRQQWNGGLWIRYKIFEEARDETPTIEAVSASELKAMEKERNYYRNLAESYERTILALTDAIGRKDGNEQTD